MTGKKESAKGEQRGTTEKEATPSEANTSQGKRDHLDVWTEGKYRIKIGAAFPQEDGSLKLFLNALPINNMLRIAGKSKSDQTQKS